MKPTLLSTLVTKRALVMMIACGLFTRVAWCDPVTLAANYWEPFTGENLPHKGFASQLVSEALAYRNHQVDIVVLPWARILLEMQKQTPQFDGVVSIWRTKLRDTYIQYSEAYYVNELCLLKHQDDPFEYREWDDLSEKLIGVGRDFHYSDRITQADHFFRADSVTIDQNLMRLIRRRIDLVLADCVIAQHYQQKLVPEGGDRIALLPVIIERQPLYFGVPVSHPVGEVLLEDFNLGLKALRESGRLQAIYQQWHITMPE